MRTRLYRPTENVYPGTLVVAPYPFGGTPANSDARLQEIAVRAQVDILGVQAVGTGNRAIIDLGRRATTIPRFRRSCLLDLGGVYRSIKAYGKSYDQLIGWGDSGRGINVLRMQWDNGPFDRLLIRDGINLDFKGTRWQQSRRFLGYSERELPKPTTDLPPGSGVSLLGKLAVLPGTIAEFYNYSQALATNEGYNLAMRLAQCRSLPMRAVGVSHSFTGTAKQATKMAVQLKETRRLNITTSEPYCDIHANVIPGGHSELLRPGLAAQHIGEVMAIETAMISWEATGQDLA